ncbi:recombination regulator RecX [Aquabacterium sp.]|uniref:recombination regulator RecX n=1 Tax=Aquabacterium sp. TaxID=1872578 RepID=UPI0035B2A02F
MSGVTLSLKGRALRYLSAREHSRSELARKLARHSDDADEVERVLDELTAKGWLSAERFVESVVHRRAERFGAARIRQELQQHGIDAAESAAALDALRQSEPERARAVWQRRFGSAPTTPADKARQMRFLIGRGFSADVIRLLLNELPRDGSQTADAAD